MTTNKTLTHATHYKVKPEALDNNLMNGLLFIIGNSTEKENSRWKVYDVGAENVKY